MNNYDGQLRLYVIQCISMHFSGIIHLSRFYNFMSSECAILSLHANNYSGSDTYSDAIALWLYVYHCTIMADEMNI